MPGPLAQGNQAIDQLLVAPIQQTSLLQAQQSHAQFHQNANSLHKQFHLTREQAHQVVKQCPQCVIHNPVPSKGVDPMVYGPTKFGKWMLPIFLNLVNYSGYMFVLIPTPGILLPRVKQEKVQNMSLITASMPLPA